MWFNKPQGLFRELSLDVTDICLVRLDGTVGCWGDGTTPDAHVTCAQKYAGYDLDCGQSAPPTGTFIEVTSGWLFSCGIRTDGALACWGLGQPGDMCGSGLYCDAGSGGCTHPCGDQATPPAGTYVKISTASSGSCAIRTDGTLACWGWQLPSIPSGIFTDVSDADASACAVRTDGSVVCWGNPDDPAVLSPPSGHFLQVAANGSTACALRDDYTVMCWGDDTYGWVSQAPASL